MPTSGLEVLRPHCAGRVSLQTAEFFIVLGRRPGTSHVCVGWLAPPRHVRDSGGSTVSCAKSKYSDTSANEDNS